MIEAFVLDACALIANLSGEAGGERVERLLDRARLNEIHLSLHALNLYEIYYPYLRNAGHDVAESIWSDVMAMPVKILYTFDEPLVRKAAEIKAQQRLSVADSFLLALAVSLGAKVVTSDHHEFDAVERTGLVRFEWIR